MNKYIFKEIRLSSPECAPRRHGFSWLGPSLGPHAFTLLFISSLAPPFLVSSCQCSQKDVSPVWHNTQLESQKTQSTEHTLLVSMRSRILEKSLLS